MVRGMCEERRNSTVNTSNQVITKLSLRLTGSPSLVRHLELSGSKFTPRTVVLVDTEGSGDKVEPKKQVFYRDIVLVDITNRFQG